MSGGQGAKPTPLGVGPSVRPEGDLAGSDPAATLAGGDPSGRGGLETQVAAFLPTGAADPDVVRAALAGCERPHLIGVRHHSAALAAAMPSLLDAARPQRVLVELPADLGHWLPWLADPTLEAPVALAATVDDARESLLVFLPMADFSPELAAIRWAALRGVPVEAFDRPIGARAADERRRGEPDHATAPGLAARLAPTSRRERDDDLWDARVEARAPGQSPESVRQAALLLGFALRFDEARSGTFEEEDLLREAHMRARLAQAHAAGERTVAVVGAYHAAGLLPAAALDPLPRRGHSAASATPVVSALVPYLFELMDARSGYPAGVLDPAWRQRVFESLVAGAPLEDAVAAAVVAVCRRLRAAGHSAGTPDAREAFRAARELAALRRLPCPGRRELLEGLGLAVAQGDSGGRARVLEQAQRSELVGDRRGALPAGAPRCGLAPHVERLLARLKLPGPGERAAERRLDPLRSPLDRSRVVALERLTACGVVYGERVDTSVEDALTEVWQLHWTPQTDALLAAAGARGVTLSQATEGALRAEAARATGESEGARAVERLDAAARCGLGGLLAESYAHLEGPFVACADLSDLATAHGLLLRIERGHVPGVPLEAPGAPDSAPEADLGHPPAPSVRAALLQAMATALEGAKGSARVSDARALVEVIRSGAWAETRADAAGPGAETPEAFPLGLRLRLALHQMRASGSALMQGAALAALVEVGELTADDLDASAASWLDPAARGLLELRLLGALTVAPAQLEGCVAGGGRLADHVEGSDDAAFFSLLVPARAAFGTLPPTTRARWLEGAAARLGGDPMAGRAALADAPTTLATLAAADAAAHRALVAMGLGGTGTPQAPATTPPGGGARTGPDAARPPFGAAPRLAPLDRWRLVLLSVDGLSPAALAVAQALSPLDAGGAGTGAGSGASWPTAREWSEALEARFGPEVRDEVLARAAAGGFLAAAAELSLDAVEPSVDLLRSMLALAGGLPEAQLVPLRRLLARMVEALTAALAVRLAPALVGLTSGRSTRRGTRLDLSATLRRNLQHTRRGADGTLTLDLRSPRFRARARRTLDWDVLVVVDLSGSMEASTVHAALTAAVLASLPGVSVQFLGFDTRVVDLTHHVEDPLALLLEVRVGGGTSIARALRAARQRVRVPSRTLLALVTDFEEGGPISAVVAEVRALAESGVQLMGLAALGDAGEARFHRAAAEQVAAAGMPVAALSPLALAQWVAERLRR